MSVFLHNDLPDRLRKHLSQRPRRPQTEWRSRPAAVLIPLYFENETWHALFTRRTQEMESHKGQVSFPGGLIEPHDPDPAEAAVREAQEEIGLAPRDVELLGMLDPVPTVTGYVISPVVARIPWPYPLRLSESEVARAFGVPLSWLADPDNVEQQEHVLRAGGTMIQVHFFKPYDGETIWGATARVTLELLEEIHQLTP